MNKTLGDIFQTGDSGGEPDLIGMEIELEGLHEIKHLVEIGELDPMSFWRCTLDGSLREGGVEYVLSAPYPYLSLPEILDEIQPKIEHGICSLRTSVHVHLDMRDKDKEYLSTFLAVYLVLERSLYRYCGVNSDRAENIYCVPCFKSEESMLFLRHFFEKNNSDSLKRLVLSWSKYHGLNLGALASFGSIEFRHMEGCNDIVRIKDWVDILQSIKKVAESEKIGPVLLERVSSQAFLAELKEILGERLGTLLLGYDGVEADLLSGVRLYQQSLTPVNPEVLACQELKTFILQKGLSKVAERNLQFVSSFERQVKRVLEGREEVENPFCSP